MKIQKQIKHLFIVCFVVVISLFLSACIGSDLESFYITRAENIKLNVGETYTFDNYYISSDEEIFAMDGNVGTALKTGKVFMTKPDSDMVEYVISIEYMPKYIDVSCDNILKPGDTSELEIVISPIRVSQEVVYEISDESIIRIEDNTIIAVNEGYADVKIKSKVKEDVYTSIGFIVQNSDEIDYEDKIEFEYEENSQINIDSTNIGAQINSLMKSVENTFVGIEQYTKSTMSDFGGGVLYKRNAVLADDSIIEDVDYHNLDENIKYFEYYVITTRNLVKDASRLKIYLGEEYDSIEATLVQYDPKVDLSLLKFNSAYYLPIAKLADSDQVKQGEFIISLNNSNGKDYFKTITYGVVSHTKRYIATDTDDDQTSDWDSEFIQHDASINSENAKKVIYTSGDIYNYINGGALFNLKGELIGLDSMKISATDATVNNMSLSIPSNLIVDITNILITGKQPQRPLLGVTILDVSAYYKNKEYYAQQYGDLNIPDGLEFGFYINEIVEGGVAYLANAKIGDILIKFNGVETRYSYIIRAELGKFIIGSGDTAELVVLRNGEEVTLTVTF